MADVKGDTAAAVNREFWLLPGDASIAVARLGDADQPSFSLAYKAEQPMAVASAFKLFLLAELSRSVTGGERKWTDVVLLDQRSVPSGFLQTWPKAAPMTLYSLAALMISQSDNSATDTLLRLLGREKVEALLPALGVRMPERLRPLLGTREAALLKAGPDAALSEQWTKSDEAQRRALLGGQMAERPPEDVDLGRLVAGATNAQPSAEWYASTGDLVRTLDWLRRHGDTEVLDILAINSGVPRTGADDFAYLGFKNGIDAGVINMTFLLRDRQGGWHAISGTWNNPRGAVDESKFALLMRRAMGLVK